MNKFSISAVVLFMCYSLAFAQDKEKSAFNKNWEVGLNMGVQRFTGEWNMYGKDFLAHSQNWTPGNEFGMGALVKRNFSHVFSLEFGLNYTNLSGTNWNKSSVAPAPKDFRTGTTEFDLNTVWNINNLFSKNKFDRKVYWFAKVGYGVTYLNDKAAQTPINGKNWQLITVPLGTGLAFRLKDNLRLNIGTQWTWINTDRLDGYADNTVTHNSKYSLAKVDGTKLYTYAGLSFSFGKKKLPEPVVQPKPEPKPQPKPEPKPEPKPQPKPEPKPEPRPEPVKVVKPAVIGNVYKVYFGFEKWDINKSSASDLDRLAADMIAYPSVNVEIKSYTDSRGPASYNMKLSEKRSKSALDYLVGKGIAQSRINAQAFGETQLVNKCKDGVPCTKAEYAVNRRTEIIITE